MLCVTEIDLSQFFPNVSWEGISLSENVAICHIICGLWYICCFGTTQPVLFILTAANDSEGAWKGMLC